MPDPHNACPSGCGRSVRPGYLLCGACWWLVPKLLQLEVWRTWRAYQHQPTDDRWLAYLEAREDALEAIA